MTFVITKSASGTSSCTSLSSFPSVVRSWLPYPYGYRADEKDLTQAPSHLCWIAKTRQRKPSICYSAEGKQQRFSHCSWKGKWDPVKGWRGSKAAPFTVIQTGNPRPGQYIPRCSFYDCSGLQATAKSSKTIKIRWYWEEARKECLIFTVWWEWYFILFTQTSST